jgi:hypothetical protein
MKTEMNIEHEGKTYEVLTLDRISEITHAKLAGGKVVHGAWSHLKSVRIFMVGNSGEYHVWNPEELADFGIQPLRLVPKEPVTFEGDFALVNGFWTRVACLDEGIALQGCEQKRFRCVEIVEEGA